MRVRIVFSLVNRGGVIPFHHQPILSNVITELIRLGGSKEFAHYHQYNFSALKGKMKISNNGLSFFSSKITLVFSSINEAFVDYFISTLLEQKKIIIGELELIPDSIQRESLSIDADSTKFLCISPIILCQHRMKEPDKGRRFISPNSDEFSDWLYNSTMGNMIASGQYHERDIAGFYKFQLIPDNDYLDRLQESGKKYSRIYSLYDRGLKYQVRGYTFPFVMHAPKSVLLFIYQNGLGYFSNKGFGMVDVIRSEELSVDEKISH